MGHFHTRLLVDYAVECHFSARKAEILIVYSNAMGTWSGERIIASGSFDPSPHSDYCENTVGVATPSEIRSYAQAFTPEELQHLPLKEIMTASKSTSAKRLRIIRYFNSGKWLALQGAD